MVLNAKQKRFVEEYVIDVNATQAAIRAGYSKKSAADIGYENIHKPEIAKAIEHHLADLRDKAELTAAMVIDELRSLAFYNVQTFIDDANAIKSLIGLPLGKTRPVLGIKSKESFFLDGTREVTTELKFHDKRGPLADLGKHLGVFEKDNEQKRPNIDLTTLELPQLSNEEIISYLQQRKNP